MVDTAGLSEAHAHWLEDRGISIEIAAEMGLTSKGREIGFPCRETDGALLFTKWRGPEKSFRIEPTGRPLILWGLDRLAESSSDTLIITEGEIDALSVMTAGAGPVVSVPNGAPSKSGNGDIVPADDRAFGYLWEGTKLRPELAPFSRFVLATDGDWPGLILRDELAVRLGRKRCHFVTYPADCKDANDVLCKHGREGVLALIANARPMVPDQLVTFSAIPASSSAVSLSSGWRDLDPHLMFALPEVCVLSGAPNAGKSQLALAIVANLARVHGLRTAILQFEDDVDRHRHDLGRYARAWSNGNGKPIAMAPDAWIDEHFLTVPPPEDIEQAEDKTLAWLLDRIEEAATRHGCKVVLLDPWNEVEHAWGVNETETAYTGRALRQLRALARRYQLLILVVTHPSKSGGMKGANEMTPYDIAGSAHWANKPDHVILIHRERGADETIVNIAKSRDYRRRGIPGVMRMRFDFRTATFAVTGKG